jgi:L-Ala-D/L-Glu epimerase
MSPRTTIRSLQIEPLRIPFRETFRHASAERSETSSLWVEAVSEGGAVGCGECCPRPYVTGETLESATRFFSQHEPSLREEVVDLPSLEAWMAAHPDELDANPAAWCAIELAFLDAMAKEAGQPIEALLGLPPLRGRFRYTAVLGDADRRVFHATAERYRGYGFTDLKMKLSGHADRDRDHLDILRQWGAESIRLRVDANNLWTRADEAITFLRALNYPFFAIEEPVRANQVAELRDIGCALDCRIVLDESFVRLAQLAPFEDSPDRWLINVRVSKMGGLLRSLVIVEAARRSGIGLIVGAQVGETSLLTRAALTVAHASGATLVAQEGAFGTLLLERDVCSPSLMFGVGGVLVVESFPQLKDPGLGLTFRVAA